MGERRGICWANRTWDVPLLPYRCLCFQADVCFEWKSVSRASAPAHRAAGWWEGGPDARWRWRARKSSEQTRTKEQRRWIVFYQVQAISKVEKIGGSCKKGKQSDQTPTKYMTPSRGEMSVQKSLNLELENWSLIHCSNHSLSFLTCTMDIWINNLYFMWSVKTTWNNDYGKVMVLCLAQNWHWINIYHFLSVEVRFNANLGSSVCSPNWFTLSPTHKP